MSLKPNDRAEFRRISYKVVLGAAEGRGRRKLSAVAIRRNQRENHLQKKRREVIPETSPLPQLVPDALENKRLENLALLVGGVYSLDSNIELVAATQLRRLLSVEKNPPVDEVIQLGVVPRLVEFLTRDDYPQLQFEAAWALSNIVAGTSDHAKVVIDHGAIPIFVKLLSSPNDDVRNQAVCALGNVACDTPTYRDLVLDNDALIYLSQQLNENTKPSMLRNVAWTLSNLCKGKPQLSLEQVKPALQWLIHSNDVEVLSYACWALTYLTEENATNINAVIKAGFCPRLVELLIHPSTTVLIPALHTVGNIAAGNYFHTQSVIDHHALPCFLSLLHTQNNKIEMEVCWTISNITAGTHGQIQAVIDAGLVDPLVQLLKTSEFNLKKEAVWAITNAIVDGTNDQVRCLVRKGCIKPLCDLLVCPDPMAILLCLEAIEKILKVGEVDKKLGGTRRSNLFAEMINEADGLDKIENLQSHANCKVYDKAVKILQSYWTEEDMVMT
ncbi:importin subunit alpha-1a [Canna indica]|uniref:Importin subunit alpha n=1 Tax=Canna indica TaxID=4628 RepID=A0AAQ3QJW0_9LILI|nr:importin subunit alpha-1a [Canna indica]